VEEIGATLIELLNLDESNGEYKVGVG